LIIAAGAWAGQILGDLGLRLEVRRKPLFWFEALETASDPAREPMLKRTHPGDALDGSTIPEDTNAEILLHDGSWAWCRVIGQRKDRLGRWSVGIRWYPSATIGESGGWYIYESGLIRRLDFDD